MPGGASVLKLGSVFLNYCVFSWPRYRGLIPRAVEITQPAARYAELDAELSALGGNPTSLVVVGPDSGGARPGDDSVVIEGVYVHRLWADGLVCRMTLYDARWRLMRYISDRDFNMRFGDGYLKDTEWPSYKTAIQNLIGTSPAVEDLFADDALTRIPARNLPDNQQLNGLPMLTALGLLCEEGGFDLVARVDGKLTFSNRLDAANDYLPDRNDFDWLAYPGWTSAANRVLGRPQKFYVYSNERHCLRLTNADETTTAPKELQFKLEQVYIAEGTVYTLAELLDAYGFVESDLTDAQIADSFLTDTFQGSVVSRNSHTANGRAVIAAVKDGWRRLWRIVGANDQAKWGAWTDYEFGKIASDGSTIAAGAECPWEEIFTVLDVDQNASSTIGARLSESHASPSPFLASWAFDAAAGVIRLDADTSRLKDRQSIAVPGALDNPLRVTKQPAVKDGEGQSEALNGYQIVEAEDLAKAKFAHSFTLHLYLCATKRLPNNQDRYHLEIVDGYGDGDVVVHELGPSERVCVRDYVDATDVDHQARSDGFGPILNQSALESDAERRAQQWMVLYGMVEYEPAVAERLRLFRDWDLNGPIREIAMDMTLEGPSGDVQVMRSRMEVGPLTDPQAVDERKRQRINARAYRTRGVDVA